MTCLQNTRPGTAGLQDLGQGELGLQDPWSLHTAGGTPGNQPTKPPTKHPCAVGTRRTRQ